MRAERLLPALLCTGGCAAIIATAQPALANGRFPRAQRLVENADDGGRLVLAATYGLLLTENGGGEWRHLCELGYAFTIDEIDPLVDLSADGSLLVQSARTLNRASAPYCDFAPVLGSEAGTRVVDFSVTQGERDLVIALVLGRDEQGRARTRVAESRDGGRTFDELGTALPNDAVAVGLTLDVAPSDSSRLYVSGTAPNGAAVLARSADRGASWMASSPTVPVGEYPYIAAVHPTRAGAVYVRTDAWRADAEGVLTADDALHYSEDGGATFRELHRAEGKLFGFALSPDGAQVLIAYGDPVSPARVVDRAVLGIYRASTSDHVFHKIFDGPVSCLTWTARGVYACTSQAERGFALGFRPEPDFELETGEPFEPLLDLREVRGPLACPACSSAAPCRALWSESCLLLGSCEAGPPPAQPAEDDCAGGAPGGGETPTSPARPDQTSCTCRSTPAGAPLGATSWLVLLLAGLLAKRRGSSPG